MPRLRWSPSSPAQISPEERAQSQAGPPLNASAREAKSSKPGKDSKDGQATIWLREGQLVRPLEVKPGTSDGANTAVTGDGLQEGQEVVTGEAAANSQSSVKNPFLPQINRR